MQFEKTVDLGPGSSLLPSGPPGGDPQVVRLPLYGPNAHPVNEIILAAVSETPVLQILVYLWVWDEGEQVWLSLDSTTLTVGTYLTGAKSIPFRTWVDSHVSRAQPSAYVFVGTGGLSSDVRVMLSTAFGQPPVQVRTLPGEPLSVEIEGGGQSLEQPLEVVNSPGTSLAVELSAPVEITGDIHVEPSSDRHASFSFIRSLASADPEIIEVDLDGFPYWSALFYTPTESGSALVTLALSNDEDDPPAYIDVTPDFAYLGDLFFAYERPLSIIADTPIMAKHLRITITPSSGVMNFSMWFKKGNV